MYKFRVNNHITLRLQGEKTVIYVDNEEFMQCKSLLLNIPSNDSESFGNIESIDEAADIFTWSEVKEQSINCKISPEVEFWGHCSNLQVWSEFNYDTRLLHSNLAFPLLKKLTDVGDIKAARAFKLEILKRYNEGTQTTKEYLISNQYLDFLSEKDIRIILPVEEVLILEDLENNMQIDFSLTDLIEGITEDWVGDFYYIENYHIIGLKIRSSRAEILPDTIGKLRFLKFLNLSQNHLRYLPESISRLKNLEILNIGRNYLEELPKSFINLERLKELNLRYNKLREIPSFLGKLMTLKKLYLEGNPLEFFPPTLGDLKKDDYNIYSL